MRKKVEFLKRKAKAFKQEYRERDSVDILNNLCNLERGLQNNDPENRVETLNELACCYRRINRLREAMRYLHQAMDIEKEYGLSSGITRTNLSAVYHSMGNPQKALHHSKIAVEELRELYKKKKNDEEVVMMLAISYYNISLNKFFFEGDPENAKFSIDRSKCYLIMAEKDDSELFQKVTQLEFKIQSSLRENRRMKEGNMENSQHTESQGVFPSTNSNKYSRSQVNEHGRPMTPRAKNRRRPGTAKPSKTQEKKRNRSKGGKSSKRKKSKKRRNRNKSQFNYDRLDPHSGVNDPLSGVMMHNHELGHFRTKNMYRADELSREEDKRNKKRVVIGKCLFRGRNKRLSPYKSRYPHFRIKEEQVNNSYIDSNEVKDRKNNNFSNNKKERKKKAGVRVEQENRKIQFEEEEYVDEDEKLLLDQSWDENGAVESDNQEEDGVYQDTKGFNDLLTNLNDRLKKRNETDEEIENRKKEIEKVRKRREELLNERRQKKYYEKAVKQAVVNIFQENIKENSDDDDDHERERIKKQIENEEIKKQIQREEEQRKRKEEEEERKRKEERRRKEKEQERRKRIEEEEEERKRIEEEEEEERKRIEEEEERKRIEEEEERKRKEEEEERKRKEEEEEEEEERSKTENLITEEEVADLEVLRYKKEIIDDISNDEDHKDEKRLITEEEVANLEVNRINDEVTSDYEDKEKDKKADIDRIYEVAPFIAVIFRYYNRTIVD